MNNVLITLILFCAISLQLNVVKADDYTKGATSLVRSTLSNVKGSKTINAITSWSRLLCLKKVVNSSLNPRASRLSVLREEIKKLDRTEVSDDMYELAKRYVAWRQIINKEGVSNLPIEAKRLINEEDWLLAEKVFPGEEFNIYGENTIDRWYETMEQLRINYGLDQHLQDPVRDLATGSLLRDIHAQSNKGQVLRGFEGRRIEAALPNSHLDEKIKKFFKDNRGESNDELFQLYQDYLSSKITSFDIEKALRRSPNWDGDWDLKLAYTGYGLGDIHSLVQDFIKANGLDENSTIARTYDHFINQASYRKQLREHIISTREAIGRATKTEPVPQLADEATNLKQIAKNTGIGKNKPASDDLMADIDTMDLADLLRRHPEFSQQWRRRLNAALYGTNDIRNLVREFIEANNLPKGSELHELLDLFNKRSGHKEGLRQLIEARNRPKDLREFSEVPHEDLLGTFRHEEVDNIVHAGSSFDEQGKRYFTQTEYDAIEKNPYMSIDKKSITRVGDRIYGTTYYAAPDKVQTYVMQILRRTEAQLKATNFTDKEKIIEIVVTMKRDLVSVHPFLDGNGRSIRLFADTIYNRYNLPPPLRANERELELTISEAVKFEKEQMYAYLEAYRKHFQRIINKEDTLKRQ